MKPDDIPGWFVWPNAQQAAVDHFPPQSKFVEVGNYLGKSLCNLAQRVKDSGKQHIVVGVDTCMGSGLENNSDNHITAITDGGGTFAGSLHRNIIACGLADIVTLMVTNSVRASKLFTDNSLDWVHIDARHDYDSVCEDINHWLPKVKVGGWLSGDDYIPKCWPGVVRAVLDKLPTATPWDFDQWRYIND